MTLRESVILLWGMNMRVVVVLLLVALVSGCASPSQTLSSRDPVSTDTGSVVAYEAEDNILQWYDIPYAQAPVGDLRWRAPKALPVTDAPIVRSADPIICPQEAGFVSGVEGESAIGSEDCLYLDVTAPADADGSLPVMFWIHGGGNTAGHKNDYDFSRLAVNQNVVVVTINYRLGPLGWFSHPVLDTGPGAISNFGTLDIIAALGWVQRNIAQFGGDKDNVTIFGESAGGHNVFTMLASPLSEGLFHKAISQSGYVRSMSPREAYNRDREFPEVDRGSWEFTGELGLDPETVSADALRAIDSNTIISTYFGMPSDHRSPGIINDGVVIPSEGFAAALANPQYAKTDVPVMAGANNEEVTLWMGLNRYFVDAAYPLTKWLPPKVTLKNPEMYKFWVRQRSEGWKAQGVDRPLASLEAAGYTSLYAYRYDWNDQEDSFLIKFSEVLGAAHASEISFVQGKAMYGPIGSYMYPDTDSARDMTDIMMTAWGNFARDGKPGSVKGDAWAPYVSRAPHYMVLDSLGAHELQADAASMEAIFAQVADTDLMTADERCILAWELATALADPAYGAYRRWNGGECADVDVRALRKSIREALEAEFG
ncbi:MAG: carboxylesterase family protein, partial [Halieaceae bacterium]